jgi:hypothetical protein
VPRIVNYSDRADAVGEKVVALVVAEGYGAMTRERVATALGWSLSTLRRLVSSEALLPGTAVHWIEEVRRYRYFRTMRTLGRDRDPWRYWTALIEAELPLEEDMIAELTAWRLVTAPGRDPRPAAAGEDYHRLLGGFCARLADLACTDGRVIDGADQDVLAARTHVVVAGLQTGAAEGWLTVPLAQAVWDDLRAELDRYRPLAPDVNDR